MVSKNYMLFKFGQPKKSKACEMYMGVKVIIVSNRYPEYQNTHLHFQFSQFVLHCMQIHSFGNDKNGLRVS